MSKRLLLITCALGAMVSQFALAAGTLPATPAANIVPVTTASTASRERNGMSSVTPAVPHRDVPSDARRAAESSTLDREIGTASDGGYIYYGVERR